MEQSTSFLLDLANVLPSLRLLSDQKTNRLNILDRSYPRDNLLLSYLEGFNGFFLSSSSMILFASAVDFLRDSISAGVNGVESGEIRTLRVVDGGGVFCGFIFGD